MKKITNKYIIFGLVLTATTLLLLVLFDLIKSIFELNAKLDNLGLGGLVFIPILLLALIITSALGSSEIMDKKKTRR